MPSNNGATISRELAVKILNEADIGFFVESSIFKNLSDNKISSKDRSLTTEIVYGSIRWRDRLDSIIDKLLKYHSNRLHPEIRNILRVAIYQILFLNKIPVHAIVHQAVKQAGARLRGRFSGLVNAVIRSALRNPDILYFEPARNSKSLATYYSHPKWLIDRWLNKFGLEKTIKILETNNQRSCLTLRVNLLKINILELGSFFQEEGVDFEIIDHDRGVLRVNKTKGPVNSIPGFKKGFFVIQDFASQMIAPFLLAQPDHKILDICGAPGGKSSHVA
ncbi:MAG: transcription antitermination factor NusB, partial [Desulfomonilaceae bacterium]